MAHWASPPTTWPNTTAFWRRYSGAGAPQVIAYTTAWSLYTIQRLFNWEIHMMAPRVVWLRAATSFPLPFLAGIAAMLVGKP